VAGLSYLADACALIMYHGRGAASMSEAGRLVMEEGDVFVSPITVWEITRKAAMGKLARPMPADYSGRFSSWLDDTGYRVVPLTWDDCERANALPDLHKDPMDRMLIASALGNGMTIITNDRVIARYSVATIW
jgi:PIN domain nuclease of toxin-antitoxin system